MNAVFSSSFKTDLLREETRYAEVSERLSGDFHERVAGLVREVIRWRGATMLARMVFRVGAPSRFPFTSITRSKETRFTFWAWSTNAGIRTSSRDNSQTTHSAVFEWRAEAVSRLVPAVGA